MANQQRTLLLRFVGWFLLANALLFFLVGLNLLSMMPFSNYCSEMSVRGELSLWVFLLMSYVGQYSMLALLVSLPIGLVAVIYPRFKIVGCLGVMVMSLTQIYLIGDSLSYHLFHFHVLGVVWQILLSGTFSEVLVLSPLEYTLVIILLLATLIIECILAFVIGHYVKKTVAKKRGRWITLVLASCLLISYTLFMVSLNALGVHRGANITQRLMELDAEIIPFYESILGQLIGHYGSEKLQSAYDGFFLQLKQVAYPLHYPLHPLVCRPSKKPLNIVIIGIDTWRYDMLNAQLTPHIYQFAQRSWQFEQHFSGGNSTRPGLFSLFYSLPATYWTSALEQHKGALFIDKLLQDHYQMGVFMSASMKYPAFNRTIFVHLPHPILTTKGKNTLLRDKRITQEFQQFILGRKKNQPFFSFLFYDAVHNYCGKMPPKPFQKFRPIIQNCNRLNITEKTPITPYLNRYKNAVFFDDALVGQVLKLLKNQQLLNHTVVIITADHGSSFNDNHQGYWGHASGFIHYQTQTPMIIYWPGKVPKRFDYKTSHYDLMPTLMHRILGCINPSSDYSVGHSLLKKGQRPFLIASSYSENALLTNQRITTIYPEGNYQITDLKGKPLAKAQLNMKILHSAYQQMVHYFKKTS